MKVETVVGKPHGLGENSHICRLNETQLPGPFQKGTRCSKQMESHQPWHGKRRGKQWQVHFRGKKFVEQHGGWYIPFDGWNPAITHQLIYGSLSPYLQGGYTSQAVIRISEPWTVFFWTIAKGIPNEYEQWSSQLLKTMNEYDSTRFESRHVPFWIWYLYLCNTSTWNAHFCLHCIAQVFAIFPNACRQCWFNWV